MPLYHAGMAPANPTSRNWDANRLSFTTISDHLPLPRAQNGAMGAALLPVVAALAELSDTELRALIDATSGVTQTAPGLLAWIEAACD